MDVEWMLNVHVECDARAPPEALGSLDRPGGPDGPGGPVGLVGPDGLAAWSDSVGQNFRRAEVQSRKGSVERRRWQAEVSSG